MDDGIQQEEVCGKRPVTCLSLYCCEIFTLLCFFKMWTRPERRYAAGVAQSWKEVLFHSLLLKYENLIKTSCRGLDGLSNILILFIFCGVSPSVYLPLSKYSTLHIFLGIKCRRSPLPASRSDIPAFRSDKETWERNLFQVSLGKSYGPSLSSDHLYRHNSAEKMLLSSALVTFQLYFRV